MTIQMKPVFPLVAGLILGAFAATAALTVREPDNWEGCMVKNLGKAQTKEAVQVLSMYCNIYPRRSKDPL